jgi:hypothetical protein
MKEMETLAPKEGVIGKLRIVCLSLDTGDGRRRVDGRDGQGKSNSWNWHDGSLAALDSFGTLETW